MSTTSLPILPLPPRNFLRRFNHLIKFTIWNLHLILISLVMCVVNQNAEVPPLALLLNKWMTSLPKILELDKQLLEDLTFVKFLLFLKILKITLFLLVPFATSLLVPAPPIHLPLRSFPIPMISLPTFLPLLIFHLLTFLTLRIFQMLASQ